MRSRTFGGPGIKKNHATFSVLGNADQRPNVLIVLSVFSVFTREIFLRGGVKKFESGVLGLRGIACFSSRGVAEGGERCNPEET